MADKTKKTTAKKTTAQVAPGEAKTYKVTARRHLGASITGGARIPKGKKGEVSLTPERYERLKKSGAFE